MLADRAEWDESMTQAEGEKWGTDHKRHGAVTGMLSD